MTSLVLLTELQAHLGTTTTNSVAVAELRRLVEEESRHLERLAMRRFDHRVETRYYDSLSLERGGHIDGLELVLDDDLLSVNSISNAGTAITSGYSLLPSNTNPFLEYSPKHRIRLDSTGTQYWGVTTATVDLIGAISVTGVWGYGGTWTNTGLTGSLAATSTTTLNVTGHGQEQEAVLRMGTEYMRISSVTDTANVEVERGYNGSTAAVQTAAAIYRFDPSPFIKTQVRRLVAWRLEQQKSPLFGVVRIADIDMPVNISSTPDDVLAALMKAGIRKQVRRLYAV